MKLNNEIVVAKFDGGKIILIVDQREITPDHEMKARDLHGYDGYLVEFDLAGYNGKTKETYLDYYLDRKYFDVCEDLYLEPVYLNKTVMDKYNLEFGSEVDEQLLMKLEDEINDINHSKSSSNKIVRR